MGREAVPVIPAAWRLFESSVCAVQVIYSRSLRQSERRAVPIRQPRCLGCSGLKGVWWAVWHVGVTDTSVLL